MGGSGWSTRLSSRAAAHNQPERGNLRGSIATILERHLPVRLGAVTELTCDVNLRGAAPLEAGGTWHFTAEHDALRETIRDFVAKELRPHADEWEEAE